jgi:hypothetical protein
MSPKVLAADLLPISPSHPWTDQHPGRPEAEMKPLQDPAKSAEYPTKIASSAETHVVS